MNSCERRYVHPNGYSAVLYGTASMNIYDPDGNMYLHTSFRTPNTEAEVMEMLEKEPEFLKMIFEEK